MSDSNDANEPSAEEALPFDPNTDWYLSEYIKFANKGMRFPVTLYCSGLLVSGILIGGREYFERAAEQVQQSFSDPESKTAISDWVTGWAEIYPPVSSDDSEESSGDEATIASPPGYIHLMAAKVFTPGQAPIPGNKEGMLWRGRLSSVDGFTWGMLAVAE